MLFNIEKCKVMYIGHNIVWVEYEMNGKNLQEVTDERYLGVIIQSDLKCSIQCIKAVKTANRVLGMIKRTFSVRDKDIILQLYKSLVRPHLQKDIALIEGVQRRVTKLISSLEDKTYEERLYSLNLITLETRRVRVSK